MVISSTPDSSHEHCAVHSVGMAFPVLFESLLRFSRRLLVTTLTLLNAIAAPPIIGFSRKPQMG